MKILKLLIISFVLCNAQSNSENQNGAESANKVLSLFLESLRSNHWDKVFLLHSTESQKVMLGDAFVNMTLYARGDDEFAKTARRAIEFHYDKKKADANMQGTKSGTREDELLLKLKHINNPEGLYQKWKILEGVKPEWRESVAKSNDFEILIDGESAVASGEGHISVKLISEKGAWKIVKGWYVVKAGI